MSKEESFRATTSKELRLFGERACSQLRLCAARCARKDFIHVEHAWAWDHTYETAVAWGACVQPLRLHAARFATSLGLRSPWRACVQPLRLYAARMCVSHQVTSCSRPHQRDCGHVGSVYTAIMSVYRAACHRERQVLPDSACAELLLFLLVPQSSKWIARSPSEHQRVVHNWNTGEELIYIISACAISSRITYVYCYLYNNSNICARCVYTY